MDRDHLGDEQMEEHLLWTRINPDLTEHPHCLRQIAIDEYLRGIRKRKAIKALKVIFEVQTLPSDVLTLALDSEDVVKGSTIVSHDPFGRYFETTYDKETNEIVERKELRGTVALIIVFRSTDDELWGALFLDTELSIVRWEQAVAAVPILRDLWDDAKHGGDSVE